MQTEDEVEGLHNCRKFSQPLECLYQPMQTQEKKEKKFSIALIKKKNKTKQKQKTSSEDYNAEKD